MSWPRVAASSPGLPFVADAVALAPGEVVRVVADRVASPPRRIVPGAHGPSVGIVGEGRSGSRRAGPRAGRSRRPRAYYGITVPSHVRLGEDLPPFDDLAELVEVQSVRMFEQQVE